MTNSLITIFYGEYNNTDAYDCVLTYVSSKNYVCGYAIPLPIDRNSLISAFSQVEQQSNYNASRYIWHFAISTPSKDNLKRLMELADHIAILFGYRYQVVYALDLSAAHPHVHFAVNNYSYDPSHPPLSEDLFDTYIHEAQVLFQNYYPQYRANIIYKEGEYV